MRVGLLCALMLASSGLPATVKAAETPAQKAETFNRHVARALEERAAGELEQAVRHLDLALVAIRGLKGQHFDEGRTRALYHKALLLIELRRWTEAAVILKTIEVSAALGEAQRHVVREKIALVARELERERRRRAPVPIHVEVVNAPGALVRVGGREVGAAPVELERAPGRYELRVVREGFRTYTTELVVKPGQALHHRVSLERDQSPYQLPGIAVAATAGGLLIAAVVLNVMGNDDLTAADSGGQLWTDARALRDAGKEKQTAAWALYGVAGAAAVTATVLLVLAATDRPELRPTQPLQVSIDAGGAWVGASFSF